MLNPYYFLFYLMYKVLEPIAKEKDRLVFSAITLMALALLIHSLVLFITIKTTFDYQVLPTMNKYVLGGTITVLFYGLNNYLFERNNRYFEIVEKIKTAKIVRKIITVCFLIIYLLSPLFIKQFFC